MPQLGRFCFRCAQAFIPKQWTRKLPKYCGRYCRDSPNFSYFPETLGVWVNYNWVHERDAMGREYLYDDAGKRIITWEEKAEPEELMTDEEYQIFVESGEAVIPDRLRDYDDMIIPVLDPPRGEE